MSRKHALPFLALCALMLAHTPAAPALEQSSTGDDTGGVLRGLQLTNTASLASLNAVIAALKLKVNQVMTCQQKQQFWDGGSGCFGPSLATYEIRPMTVIPPNRAAAWTQTGSTTTSGGSGWFGTKGGTCNSLIFGRMCDCSPESLATTAIISGTNVIISPFQCDSYYQEIEIPCDDPNPSAYKSSCAR